jgi:hypothetical protein
MCLLLYVNIQYVSCLSSLWLQGELSKIWDSTVATFTFSGLSLSLYNDENNTVSLQIFSWLLILCLLFYWCTYVRVWENQNHTQHFASVLHCFYFSSKYLSLSRTLKFVTRKKTHKKTCHVLASHNSIVYSINSYLIIITIIELFTEVEVNIARIFADTWSVELNILALFTNTEGNNYFSIYHNKIKMIKKTRNYF